jgi:putative heme iron utilization protein
MWLLSLLLAFTDPMINLVEKGKMASLATIYKDGTPFTSLVPYALDSEGRPIIFISELAIHTKNLNKKSSCSLMVSEIDNKDLFNSARLTYMGEMKKVPKSEIDKAKKAYLIKYPDAEYLLDLEDFSFYYLEIKKIYYIGGFGDINWIELNEYKKYWIK